MDAFSYISNADVGYINDLYMQYRENPLSVDPSWQKFFEGFEFAQQHFGGAAENGSVSLQATNGHALKVNGTLTDFEKEAAVLKVIEAYRTRGHLFANINPILKRKQYQPPLDLREFGLGEEDLDREFAAGTEVNLGKTSLRNILDFLQKTYCATMGVEFRYIRIPYIVNWFRNRIESTKIGFEFSREEKFDILQKLGRAEAFEQFIHRKFPGQKRFSLEGAEAMIPALDALILHGSDLGIEEFNIGMAHRGRLNVLTNIMKKEPDNVFGEFKDKGVANDSFDGDVKYHLSHSEDVQLANGKTVHLSLAPNPSHLEAVDAIVEGYTRAKLEHLYGGDANKICPILIHGDAALAGQGLVYEVIQMSRLSGYGVGGTVHYVINNQVGFTTEPEDCRSSTYCTDVAKLTLSPVFHVNGDDPEALVYATRIAMEFRQKFHRDVFIDVYSYRKYGHNEGDEPRFTQPLMYAAIDSHKGPFEIYLDRLLSEGAVEKAAIDRVMAEYNDYLNEELDQATERTYEEVLAKSPERSWKGFKYYSIETLEDDPATGVPEETLRSITEKLATLPPDFTPHRNIKRLLEQRHQMVFEGDALDWGMGELLAYGTLLLEGHPVRISGQDVERGTFSHRHAILHDQKTNDLHIALRGLAEGQAPFRIYNSLLSEYGVLGFEVGYSYATPNGLTVWEAQFGDFVNGAQIIIDQYISSAATKWQRLSNLVLLLPHGHEGQGPEHSSARPERFLELCAANNMFVCNITTPANFFHALRRQLKSEQRRPLVLFSPKSLLRSPDALSPLKDFAPGTKFQQILDDPTAKPAQVDRVVVTSGKLAYDLLRNRDAHNKANVAVVRLEQLYPVPEIVLRELLQNRYKKMKTLVWAQEEPENMGGWGHLLRHLRDLPWEVVSRKPSGSPSSGSMSQHKRQQMYIIRKSLDLAPDAEVK